MFAFNKLITIIRAISYKILQTGHAGGWLKPCLAHIFYTIMTM